MPMYRKEYILNTFPFTSEMETFCNEMTWMVINSTYNQTIVYCCIAPATCEGRFIVHQPSNNNEEFSIWD